MKTKAKPLSRDQLKHLRSRVAEARRSLSGWDEPKAPPKVAAARKIVDAWENGIERLNKVRRRRIAKAEHAVEQTLLFDPDNALKAVQAFEKMKV